MWSTDKRCRHYVSISHEGYESIAWEQPNGFCGMNLEQKIISPSIWRASHIAHAFSPLLRSGAKLVPQGHLARVARGKITCPRVNIQQLTIFGSMISIVNCYQKFKKYKKKELSCFLDFATHSAKFAAVSDGIFVAYWKSLNLVCTSSGRRNRYATYLYSKNSAQGLSCSKVERDWLYTLGNSI